MFKFFFQKKSLCINVQAKYDNVSGLQFTIINKGYLSVSGSLID